MAMPAEATCSSAFQSFFPTSRRIIICNCIAIANRVSNLETLEGLSRGCHSIASSRQLATRGYARYRCGVGGPSGETCYWTDELSIPNLQDLAE